MFSKSTEYALRATIYVARHSRNNKKISLDEIADAIGSPKAFTAKILQKLTLHDCVLSAVRGPGGGFYISAQGLQKPVFSILEAMDENTRLEKCVLGLKKCSGKSPCPMHYEYLGIRDQLQHLFNRTKIETLASQSKIWLMI